MSNGFKYIRILFIAVALAVCGDSEPVEAGLWDYLKQYYQALQQGELDEESIPEMPMEYAGEIGLELQDKIELVFDEETPGIGEVQWMGITPEGTLLLTDDIAHQAHEFNLRDNSYIRSFGRSGRGPGEYMSADNMALDPQGRVYLLDSTRGQVLRYDRQGRFLDRTKFIRGSRVLAGRDGQLFFLGVNLRYIMELQRRDPATWKVEYRTPLSTGTQNFVSYRMTTFAKLCYNTALHVLYYLGPNDYMVKEIDAATGEITGQFGRRPKGFVVLPERYHDIGRGSLDNMNQLQISTVGSMTLLENQYLVIAYQHAGSPVWEWVVYNLNSSGRIDIYDFDEDTEKLLQPFSRDRAPMRAITAWKDRLYIWRPPPEGKLETSNGTVEIYALTFDPFG